MLSLRCSSNCEIMSVHFLGGIYNKISGKNYSNSKKEETTM